MSELAFDQSGDAGSQEDVLAKALEAAYEAGKTDALNLKTNSKPPTNPDGGWLPPDEKEFISFWNAVYDEAKRRFGVEEDGGNCVTVEMTDRSRYERIRLLPVPRTIEDSPYHPYGTKWKEAIRDPKTKKYTYPKHTAEEEEVRKITILKNKQERMRMIHGNVSIMMDQLRYLFNDLEFEVGNEIEKPEKTRQSRIKRLLFEQDMWDETKGAGPEKWAKRNGYVYNPTTFPPTIFTVDRKVVAKKPDNFDELMRELENLRNFKLPDPIKL